MENTKKVKTQTHELTKEEVRQKALTFFKGCKFFKCLSPHCPNFLGEKSLLEIREDAERNLPVVLEMIQKNELKIDCHHFSVFPQMPIANLENYFPVFSFSFVQILNLDSKSRLEIFAKIKGIVDSQLNFEPIQKKERVIEILEADLSNEMASVANLIDKKVKDFFFFETLCLFFLTFSFIFEIENFHKLRSLKNFLGALNLPATYHPNFRAPTQTPAFRHFLNREALDRTNENLQNLLALELAEAPHPLKALPGRDQDLSAICAALAFLYNLNALLPQPQQLAPKDFINESLAADFDTKTSTLLFMRESFLERPGSQISRLVASLQAPARFSFLAFPFLLPLETRVDALHFESKILQSLELQSSLVNFENPLMLLFQQDLFLELRLSRENLLEDALNELAGKGKGAVLRRGLKVKFKNEPGVDEGGLTKEFFQLLTQQLFDASFGMFLEKNERFLWFDAKSFECSVNFELVGTLLGLALYNETILPLRFPLVVYKKLKRAGGEGFALADEPGLEDLKEFEPQIFATLTNLLNQGWSLAETGLTFSVIVDFYGAAVTHELIPGGAEVAVTEENKAEFAARYLDWYFNESVKNQFEPFCRGFYNVVSRKTLALFTASDLFQAICGNEELDFRALKLTTRYEDFSESSETIAHFWQVLINEFGLEQKKAFLKFLTGSDRAPLKGLGDIKMTVTRNGPNSEQLPASHTCFNHLLLPDYKNYEKLKAKLLKAIEHCEGFGLF